MVNPRDIAGERRRRRRMVNPRDIAGERRRRRGMVKPRDLAGNAEEKKKKGEAQRYRWERKRRTVNPKI